MALAQGDDDAAEDFLVEATALEAELNTPSGPPLPMKPAHEMYGEFLLARGRMEEAAVQFNKALERTPNRIRSVPGLGTRKATFLGHQLATVTKRLRAAGHRPTAHSSWARSDDPFERRNLDGDRVLSIDRGAQAGRPSDIQPLLRQMSTIGTESLPPGSDACFIRCTCDKPLSATRSLSQVPPRTQPTVFASHGCEPIAPDGVLRAQRSGYLARGLFGPGAVAPESCQPTAVTGRGGDGPS